jgi:hypothetical protein
MTDHTKPSNETRQADETEAGTPHQADRMPTDEEAQAAEGLKTDPNVAQNYKEMAERGANQKGEGRIP